VNPSLYFAFRQRYRLNGDPVHANPFAPWTLDDLYPEVLAYELDLAGYGDLPREPEIEEWLHSLWDSHWPLLFLVERCCDDGELLPLQLRESRLKDFPLDSVVACERAIAAVPYDYEEDLFRVISWAVRIERARRRAKAY
jgi:hypothetical protein